MKKNITDKTAQIAQTDWTKAATMTDDENPEWTDEMFASAVRVDALPTSMQVKLKHE